MNRLRKLFVLSLFLFATAATARATSIVVVVTPEYILLGADSKRQVYNAQAERTAETTISKIRVSGAYCFALAGMTTASGTSFNAAALIQQHLSTATSYHEAVQSIKKDLRKALQRELKLMEVQQPAVFRQWMERRSPLLELVLLRNESGAPRMELIGFELSEGNEVQVGSYTASCPGDCPDRQVQVYFMGTYDVMENQLANGPVAHEPAVLVSQLITAQAEATPGAVGLPVRMLRFDAKGMEWLQ